MANYGTIGSSSDSMNASSSSVSRRTLVLMVVAFAAAAAFVFIASEQMGSDDLILEAVAPKTVTRKMSLAALTKAEINAEADSAADLDSAPKMTKELKEVIAKVKKQWEDYTEKEAKDTLEAAKKMYAADLAAAKAADTKYLTKLGYAAPKYAEVKPYGLEDPKAAKDGKAASK